MVPRRHKDITSAKILQLSGRVLQKCAERNCNAPPAAVAYDGNVSHQEIGLGQGALGKEMVDPRAAHEMDCRYNFSGFIT